MFSSIGRSIELAKASLSVLRSDKELLLFPLVSFIALVIVTISFAVPFLATGGIDDAMDGQINPIALAVAFAFYLVSYTVTFFFNTALVGAAIHVHRHRDEDRPGFKVDTFLTWWLVVAIGIGSIVGSLFHLFDGRQVAEEIGYTRGNGGFQSENAMGDMAIGIAGVLCARFRGYFWLAVILIATIHGVPTVIAFEHSSRRPGYWRDRLH